MKRAPCFERVFGSKTFLKMLHWFNMALGLRKQACSLTVLVIHPYCSMHLGWLHLITTSALLHLSLQIWITAEDLRQAFERQHWIGSKETPEVKQLNFQVLEWQLLTGSSALSNNDATDTAPFVSLPHLPHSSVTEAIDVNRTFLTCIPEVRTPGKKKV